MEVEINKNINTLIEDNENILKQEIKFILEEFRNKIEEHKKLKEELKNVKNSFNNGLEDYLKEKNLTIEKEREIESLLSKISKMRKNMNLSLNQTLNKKFYIHLNDISNNKQKEIILLKIFNYIFNIYNYSKLYITFQNNNGKTLPNINNIIDECQSFQELLKILRNESEIKNILSYSYEIFHNLQNENNEIFINIKNSFFELLKEINSVEKQFPFEFLLDFIKNNFIIIDYEKQVENLKIELNSLINEKNEKFVEIKNIESILKIYRRNNKIISNYIKALKSFYYRIKEQNKINSSQNINENNNNVNNNIIRELIDDIEKFKKITIDYDKINSNFDAMTSLSFGTNYTLSEKSSIKSSIIDSKNNNEDVDNENKSEGKKNNNHINNDFNINLELKNNNISMIKKENIEKNNKNENKNKLINKIQKNKRFIRNTANKNNSFINKKRNMKKNISVGNHNLSNLTTDLKSQTKNQINSKNLTINNKNLNKKNNISYEKESKNKNINKQKIINNKKNLPQKINAQKIQNKEIKKRFQSININKKNKDGKNLSPSLKAALNIKNKSQIFQKNNNSNKSKNIKNNISQNKNEKNEIKNIKNRIIDLSHTQNQENTIKLLEGGYDKVTEKDFKNKPLLSSNERYDYQNNNKYNISKKIEQLKQKENEESLEITMPNKDNNINDNYFDSNNVKDSICDEMVTQNFGTANNLIRSTTNDYINRLGFKNNVLWSENLYKNKALKFKSNFKKLNIEKPIDTSSCCAACT